MSKKRTKWLSHEWQAMLSARLRFPFKYKMPGTTFLLHMTQEQRDFEESNTRTWRGRQGQGMQSLEDDICRVDLYPKCKNTGVMYLNMCAKDCGGSETSSYLKAHKLICHRLKEADRRWKTPG